MARLSRRKSETKSKTVNIKCQQNVPQCAQLTTVLKSIRVVRMMTMVAIESRIPSVPAIIVPTLRLLHPQHELNLWGFPILYCRRLALIHFQDSNIFFVL